MTGPPTRMFMRSVRVITPSTFPPSTTGRIRSFSSMIFSWISSERGLWANRGEFDVGVFLDRDRSQSEVHGLFHNLPRDVSDQGFALVQDQKDIDVELGHDPEPPP